MSLDKQYRIVTIDCDSYYMIERYPDGYILQKYASDDFSSSSFKSRLPKHFNVYKYTGDYLCKTKEEVLDFFSDNYNIELDMSIFN
ncbi:MAG: hypothetical protein N4A44_01655 [Alphaproteobacteria bacterium]|nr:hypothetical protein [Alphaproteobacteria bacterium]